MRGKKAKRLRKQAQDLTIGKPDVNYAWGLVSAEHGPLKWVPKAHRKPNIRLDDCTRAVYQGLKDAS